MNNWELITEDEYKALVQAHGISVVTEMEDKGYDLYASYLQLNGTKRFIWLDGIHLYDRKTQKTIVVTVVLNWGDSLWIKGLTDYGILILKSEIEGYVPIAKAEGK